MDFLRSDKHKDTNEFIELILSHQQFPTITRPTRIARHSATLINNIIVNQRHCENYISMILIDDMSDHLPCLTVLKNVIPHKNEKLKFKARCLKGLVRVQEELAAMDWSALEKVTDVDIQTELLQEKMKKLLDAHCPEKELTISSRTLRREPWLTKGLMTSCRKSRELYKKTLDLSTNNCLSVLKYKQYSNTLTRLKRHAKVTYYQSKCAEFRNNTKNLWKIINKITGKVNNKSEVIDCIRIDKVRCYSSQLIANEFGEFFASIGRTYANKIPKAKQDLHYYLSKIPCEEKSIYLLPTTACEISKLICKLPNKSSSGYDKINNILLKKLNKELSVPIAMICNNSLKSGKFPTQMKTAIVVPLYKSKGRDYVNNYRPISLLMTISKLLEKVIYKRVYGFLTETKQIYDSQYGFRAGHSCENAISEVLGEIVKALQNGKTTVCILLDLSKAFDSLEHDMIFKKMERYGLRGICLKWFESYLHGRHIQVKCKTGQSTESYSNLYEIDYGTPQGSCLGPLIFMLFCNDLRLHLDYLKGIQFADDSTLLKSHSNLRYLKFCIEQDLEVIQDWFNANKLTLNVDKTVCMVFSPKNSNIKMKINLSGVELPVVPVSKFLGLWIDSKLNWNEHLRRLTTRLYSRLGLLKRSKNLLDSNSRKILYFAQFHSILSYGLLVWGNMITQTQMKKISKLQETAVQLIEPNSKIESIYKKHGILPIEKLIELENYKVWYKYYHNLIPVKLRGIMTVDSNQNSIVKKHGYNTRQRKELNLPKADGLYKKTFFVKGLCDYSKLTTAVKATPSLCQFIQECKHILLS